MIRLAKKKHHFNKNLKFSTKLPKTQLLNTIFMADVIEHLEKPKETFTQISKLMNKKTKLVITMANPIWEPLLMFWERLGLKMPEGPHKRITNKKLQKAIEGSGMKVSEHDYRLLIPVNIPLITYIANKYLEKYLKKLAFIEYFVAVKA